MDLSVGIVKARLRLGFNRIILNKTTTSFFLCSMISGLIAVAVFSASFSNDWNASLDIANALDQIGIPFNDTTFTLDLARSDYSSTPAIIKLCRNITDPVHPKTCQDVQVGAGVGLDKALCGKALQFPLQFTMLYQREDLVTLAIHLWMLFIASYSVMAESVPHLLAFLIGRLLAAVWSIWVLTRTVRDKARFEAIFAAPCGFEVDKFPLSQRHWQGEMMIAKGSLVLNIASFLACLFLGWRLARNYSRETFARMSTDTKLRSLYRVVLTLNASTQLGLFFFLASAALWLDRLRAGRMGMVVRYPALYQALFLFTVVVIPFWTLLGWYAVRRERSILMLPYLFFAILILAGWCAMFDSFIYRWYFLDWAFWASFTTVGILLMTLIVVLTVVVWTNFDKGISQWLRIERELSSCDFTPENFLTRPEDEKSSVPDEERRPSSLYNVSLKRLSSGFSFDRKVSDPFVYAPHGDTPRGSV